MVKGIGASDGIAISRVYKYEQVELVVTKRDQCDAEAELALFERSITLSTLILSNLSLDIISEIIPSSQTIE